MDFLFRMSLYVSWDIFINYLKINNILGKKNKKYCHRIYLIIW